MGSNLNFFGFDDEGAAAGAADDDAGAIPDEPGVVSVFMLVKRVGRCGEIAE